MGAEPDPRHDWWPVEDDEHAAQVAGLLAQLAPLGRPARVIDLGAGNGRIAAPLRDAGHDVLAIDNDPDAVAACAERGLTARHADMLAPDAELAHPNGPADLIACMGNTFAQVADVAQAADLLRRLLPVAAPSGALALDAVTPIWDEVAQGNWQAGVSEDGAYELVWAPGDAVVWFDRTDGTADADDPLCAVPLRLWSLGALRLLAMASGWGPPAESDDQDLTLLIRPSGA